ncbi:fimbrial biogenesis chaperone [Antarcticimicrobium luteum]|uniref:Molecular chaperone n=1 Tax=Antarcticimicrobium luteum TaxID=2547397 RepID=A0A4R5VH12_9RHOB|nr:fimbria/pilus periplasmic chaperone [Antarcticimicrobium luteum]TDK53331.1 molecular chaperone [Antarcticimicrobium luteum]
MKRAKTITAALFAALILPSFAVADSFAISPTKLLVSRAERSATLTVKSGGPDQMQGQVRVMKWTRSGGKDHLAPTRDVIASPPVLRLARNQETTIRLVRVKKAPVRQQRECYRVLIDQLPGDSQRNSAVKFTIRHSVPLCFTRG